MTCCTGNEYAVIPDKTPLTDEELQDGEEPTYATFTFKLGDAETSTRAQMQTDTYEPSQPVISFKSIRLLVFGYNDYEKKCEMDTLITNFGTEPYLPEGQSATVLIKAGLKRILVIANTAGKSMDNLLAVPHSLGWSATRITYDEFLSNHNLYDIGTPVASPNVPVAGLDFSELIQTSDPASSMVYSSDVSDSASVHAILPNISSNQSMNSTSEDDNHFEITLKRTVAKMTVATNQTPPIQVSRGKLQNLKYSLRNVNRSLYLFQQPTYGGSVYPPYDFFVVDEKDEYFFVPYFYRGYDFTDLLPASSPATPVYVTENGQTFYKGGATYAAVEAVFVPELEDVIEDFSFDPLAGFTNITHPAQFIPGSDFYYLENTGPFTNLTQFFTDSLTAYKAAYCIYYFTEPPANFMDNLNDNLRKEVREYTGGKCYYRIDFSNPQGERQPILRNHHYVLNISSFGNIGRNKPEDLHLSLWEEVVEAPIYITASVTVEPWITDYYTVQPDKQ